MAGWPVTFCTGVNGTNSATARRKPRSGSPAAMSKLPELNGGSASVGVSQTSWRTKKRRDLRARCVCSSVDRLKVRRRA